MKYFNEKHLFLFDTANELYKSLDVIEEAHSPFDIIDNVDKFFDNITGDFAETISSMVYKYVNNLNLNMLNNSKSISMGYIIPICKSILSNPTVKDILIKINASQKLRKVDSTSKFDINIYNHLMNLLEELDFICALEIYSHILNEDIEGVLSFILDKITDSVTFSNNESLESVNKRFLQNVEHKLKIFNKVRGQGKITIIVKRDDHVIYKINNTLKIVQLIK